ncbi:NFACT RNA binding domain-containing protein [Candidatus Woesearchaeota archaeon]|nr:NFACT RNA binding domain-containing protein [Candidatus Woesearchaeota archaeon]
MKKSEPNKSTISIDINKSIEENASLYYAQAKKLKSKREGITKILEKTKKDLLRITEAQMVVQKKAETKPIKKKWYHNFRWFITSKGNLAVGGRDATSNEILIKKHMDKEDIVFHTDMAGSPFFILKQEQESSKPFVPDPLELEEVAIATASFSRAWRLGLTTLDVFHVDPTQVSKTPKSGEFMGKGSFMITGKTTYIHPMIGLAVGEYEGMVMAGPLSALKHNCKKFVQITQGKTKTSQAAKKIQKKIGCGLDEIVRSIPAGGVNIL